MYTVQTLQLYENITHVHCADITILGEYHSCTLYRHYNFRKISLMYTCSDITTLGKYHSCTLYRHYNFRKISLMYTVQTLQLYENITHVHCTDITILGKYH